ncbi:ABC transporter permease [Chitinophaga silvatica]|uniref:ABC transporter permease n=1 Tax=Chitinophaga silvatica TaxID=2282649 RepID=A0A3E1Y4R9_9BACT|nr:ABC transporter permease [Chitinophaga silvatica]RFS19679.1 ABC transporter permease [Chitinophaga silvatica]
MLKNYFLIVFRGLKQHKFINLVKIGGLAVSLTSFLIILLYLNNELSYDQWHPTLKNVYRVSEQTSANHTDNPAPAALASFLQEHIPGITAYTHLQQTGDFELLFGTETTKIYQKEVVMADSGLLDVFPYQLLAGDPHTAFKNPGSALITPELSEKLFGKQDPVGKVFKLYNQLPFTVTGVLAPLSTPSHIRATAILMDPAPYNMRNSWGNISYMTYVRLSHPTGIAKLEDQINRVYYDHHLKQDNKTYEAVVNSGHAPGLFAEEVKDIHNFPRLDKSSFKTTLILFVLAVLLLISGALNAGNLSLVKAMRRGREIGVRKVLGANKLQIVKQFLLETGVHTLISLVLAGLLLILVLPWFNKAFGLSLSIIHAPFIVTLIAQVLGAVLVIIMISGIYPAWMFARQTAMSVLKQKLKITGKGLQFSNSLLVVQFSVSMFFIVAALIMLQQMSYMKNRDIGFTPEQVVQIQVRQQTWDNNFSNVRTKLLEVPGVTNVSKTTAVPGGYIDTTYTSFTHNGRVVSLTSVRVSTDIFKTLSIPVKDGRWFDDEHPEDLDNTAIINESAAKLLGGEGIIGSNIRYKDCDSVPYKIVGVVKDFQTQGFDSYVRPTFYSVSNAHCGRYQSGNSLLLKIKSGGLDKTMAGITAAWGTIEPEIPLRYSFLDDNFQRLFTDYIRVQYLVQIFTAISVIIALMGLLALTVFVTNQRLKEISIRKVMGASVGNVVLLLSKDFLRLVIIAIVLASPIAWYLVEYWLKDFAYRVNVSWLIFAVAALGVILMAGLTIGWQAIKASNVNPANSLKSE